MSSIKTIKLLGVFSICILLLSACNGKIPGADARKFPADPKQRVKKNLEEGRGFTLNKAFGNATRGGTFDFASSNELWRASLDVIDFMPLTSVNYSGGIIITDWYSDGSSSNESLKISIRFLTNEIRSDALQIKIFYKNCAQNDNCKIIEKTGQLEKELTKKILAKAATYQKSTKEKRPYIGSLKQN